MAHNLPADIWFDIFSRMPVKSLASCGCVCKSWLEYVDHPYLHAIHLKEEPTPLVFQRSPSVYPNIRCITSFLQVNTTAAVKKEPVLEFWSTDSCFWFQENRLFLSACNGLTLVCLSHDGDRGTTLGVINPLKKLCYGLPVIDIWRGESVFVKSPNSAGIGFDDSTNSFKVVCVFQRAPVWSADMDVIRRNLCTMVHVLGTSSWQEVAQVPAYPITGEGVFANGCLHWLASHSSPNQGRKVVRFDVKWEEFGMIDAPEQKGEGWINDQLVDLNGDVGFVYNNIEEISIEVWILKHNEWVMHCQIEKPTSSYGPISVSGCWNNDGDILLIPLGKELLVYRLKSGELHKINQEDDCEADIHMHRSNLLTIQKINTDAYSIQN